MENNVNKSDKKSYYWLSSYPLENGSIVKPGNWGRIVKLYTSQQSAFIYLREEIFERIRSVYFRNLPSRKLCIFLCEDIESARRFKTQTGRIYDLIYEVELVDVDKPLFITDWTFANFPIEPFQLVALEVLANKYWQAENIVNKEVLSESRVKVKSLIE